MRISRILAAASAAIVLASCAGIGARTGGPAPEAPGKDRSAAVAGIGAPGKKAPKELPQEKPGRTDDGLALAVFDGLPEEAEAFFSRLSQAFREGDLPFLSSRGEPDYSSRVRPGRDEEEYLALLYRTGAYAHDSPQAADRPPRLKPSEVAYLRYLGWEEQGPAIEMRGSLVLKSNRSVPFRVLLLWRLEEPKIIGREP